MQEVPGRTSSDRVAHESEPAVPRRRDLSDRILRILAVLCKCDKIYQGAVFVLSHRKTVVQIGLLMASLSSAWKPSKLIRRSPSPSRRSPSPSAPAEFPEQSG